MTSGRMLPARSLRWPASSSPTTRRVQLDRSQEIPTVTSDDGSAFKNPLPATADSRPAAIRDATADRFSPRLRNRHCPFRVIQKAARGHRASPRYRSVGSKRAPRSLGARRPLRTSCGSVCIARAEMTASPGEATVRDRGPADCRAGFVPMHGGPVRAYSKNGPPA
jgi:hypothetical protein